MSATTTQTISVEEPQYEYFFQDNSWNNKREILTGAKAKKTFNEIPQIDVGGIFSDKIEERKRVAEEVAVVCKEVCLMDIEIKLER